MRMRSRRRPTRNRRLPRRLPAISRQRETNQRQEATEGNSSRLTDAHDSWLPRCDGQGLGRKQVAQTPKVTPGYPRFGFGGSSSHLCRRLSLPIGWIGTSHKKGVPPYASSLRGGHHHTASAPPRRWFLTSSHHSPWPDSA